MPPLGLVHYPEAWSLPLAIAAAVLLVLLLVFLPGVVMADGMKSLNILAGIEALLLGVILPAVDGLLVRTSGTRN